MERHVATGNAQRPDFQILAYHSNVCVCPKALAMWCDIYLLVMHKDRFLDT